MSFYELIQRPICYATLKQTDDLIICPTCKCAWYSSISLKEFHASTHKQVCKEPNYDMIDQLNLEQCYDMLGDMFGDTCHPNSNSAAVLLRFSYLAKTEGKKKHNRRSELAKTLNDISFELREKLRSNFNSPEIMEGVWACPGIPQYIMFCNLQSLTFYGLAKLYPHGRPIFKNSKEDTDFDKKFNVHYDTSAEWTGCFILQFLVLTSVKNFIKSSPKDDGRAELETSRCARVSRLRIAEILSDYTLRNSLKEALYPVPGLILNVAENSKTELIELLHVGSFPGILEWADQDFCFKTLRIISTSEIINFLNEKTLIQIIEDCCHALEFPTWQYKDCLINDDIYLLCKTMVVLIMSNKSVNVFNILQKGITQKIEQVIPDWQASSSFGQKRLILVYFLEKLSENDSKTGQLAETNILEWINQWQFSGIDKRKFACKVMESNTFENWQLKLAYDKNS